MALHEGERGEALSGRERDVIELVAEGFTNEEIASKLKISHHTAKFHLTNACQKLGARNRAHAAVLFERQKIAAAVDQMAVA